jgi:hypothetical protein
MIAFPFKPSGGNGNALATRELLSETFEQILIHEYFAREDVVEQQIFQVGINSSWSATHSKRSTGQHQKHFVGWANRVQGESTGIKDLRV